MKKCTNQKKVFVCVDRKVWRKFQELVRLAAVRWPDKSPNEIKPNIGRVRVRQRLISQAWDPGHTVWDVLIALFKAAVMESTNPDLKALRYQVSNDLLSSCQFDERVADFSTTGIIESENGEPK